MVYLAASGSLSDGSVVSYVDPVETVPLFVTGVVDQNLQIIYDWFKNSKWRTPSNGMQTVLPALLG